MDVDMVKSSGRKYPQNPSALAMRKRSRGWGRPAAGRRKNDDAVEVVALPADQGIEGRAEGGLEPGVVGHLA
jgi:hypothetical protein